MARDTASIRLGRCGLAALLGLLAAAAAPVLPPPVLPGVGTVDPRVPVDGDQVPWRAVGRVQSAGISASAKCTGFLIGVRVALTAAHCLYDVRTHRFLRPGAVHFLAGYARGSYAWHTVLRALVIAPGYDPARSAETRGADWAVLLLEEPLGTPDRILPLAADDIPAATRLTLGGYGQDRVEVLEADPDCGLAGWVRDDDGRRLIEHTCSGTHGTSGAPLLARGNRGWMVIGLQVRAVPGQSLGFAVPAATLKQQIDRQAPGWLDPPR